MVLCMLSLSVKAVDVADDEGVGVATGHGPANMGPIQRELTGVEEVQL